MAIVTITYTKPLVEAIDPKARQESSVFINPTGYPLNGGEYLYGDSPLRNEEFYSDANVEAGIIKIPAYRRWADIKIDTNLVAAGETYDVVLTDITSEAGLYYASVVQTLVLAGVTGLSITGVNFVAVTGITDVPADAVAETDLTLTGVVVPINATNTEILWSVSDAGATGATITDGVLSTTGAGTVVVTATISNGTYYAGVDFTADFEIIVAAAEVTESDFIAVTNITGVPTGATAETDLTLTGTVVPATATNTTIVWSVNDAGTTGATIADATLSTTGAGTVVVTATIVNGATETTDYTQNFNITVAAE